MALLDDISYYIDTNSTKFTEATNLWVAKIPEGAADTSLVVLESAGSAPSDTFGSLPSFESPHIQVISRSTTYVVARENAEDIYRLLHGVNAVAMTTSTSTGLSPTTYYSITALQSPFPLGTDDQERELVSVNFATRKELS